MGADAPVAPAAFLAARRGDVPGVRAWLDAGGDPDAAFRKTEQVRGHQPFTYESVLPLLHAAAEGGSTAVAALLLARGADPDVRDGSGATALMVAAGRSDADMVRLLLSHGAEPAARDGFGETALDRGVRAGSAEVVRVLLDAGAPVRESAPDGITLLLRAADHGVPAAVLSLLLDAGADPNDFTHTGPLAACARRGDLEGMRLLHEHGAETNRGGALAAAVTGGHGDAVELLLSWDADVNAPDIWGVSPLLCAVLRRRHELARLLLSHGADPSARFDWDWFGKVIAGVTPLMAAAGYGDAGTVAMLLDAGVDPRHADGQGRTALGYAIARAWVVPRVGFPCMFLATLTPPDHPLTIRLLLRGGALAGGHGLQWEAWNTMSASGWSATRNS